MSDYADRIAEKIAASYGLNLDKPQWRGVREALITATREGYALGLGVNQ